MTPHEERLILELHSKLGNRWSKIARKLPGRTDNEIKNYWRTQMRKEAHDKKKKKETKQQQKGGGACSSSASPSLSNSSSSSSGSAGEESTPAPVVGANERGFYDTGGFVEAPPPPPRADNGEKMGGGVKVYSMDEIWKAIESPEIQESRHGGVMGSAIWDDYSVWTMDYDYQEDERNMVAPVCDQFYTWFDNNLDFAHNNTFLTG